ncbi:MAG: N-6 DNA methylase [Dehalococcoidia bacterium]
MAYASVTVEGGLFPPDILDQVASGTASRQKPADFRVNGGRRLSDEIQSAFADACLFWDAFNRRLERSSQSKTRLTREDWALKFLGDILGFESINLQTSPVVVGGDSYLISHRAGDDPDAPPIHIVSVEQSLDERDRTTRRSPHALVQEYLNRSDALWGIVTNGRTLRLLRNTQRLSRPTYVELNVEGMIGQNLYSEFVLMYRLLHATRFPQSGKPAHECILEQYYEDGIASGSRVRDKLRDGVHEALVLIGTALLSHPDSTELREKIRTGELDASTYYRQLLRVVYRLLFLMVAEERRLIFPENDTAAVRHAVYGRYYSMERLRTRSQRYFAGDRYGDLWESLKLTFRLFREDSAAQMLGVSILDSELFGPDACRNLESAGCSNEDLLKAVRLLSTFQEDNQVRRVNYGDLNVEELGSIYESLLDFHPVFSVDLRSFDLIPGSQRKETGSYYTPPELVHELVESALAPLMEERLKRCRTPEQKEDALLGMRVYDPAAGSGHFLLAAARRMGRELARIRTGETEPAAVDYRRALKDVIRQCIYAVEKNDLAVDLCKVALWIEGHDGARPLSFLDNHIRHGDSLIGVMDLQVLADGIPDDAYKAVTGDDSEAAKGFIKRNRKERQGQATLKWDEVQVTPGRAAPRFEKLGAMDERTPSDVEEKKRAYYDLRSGVDLYSLQVACDLWTYGFFANLCQSEPGRETVPTTGLVRTALRQPNAQDGRLVGEAMAASRRLRFFHWPLEFPDVFARGGFDVVLANPPWERIKLQEQEFFAGRDPEIARAPNKAARDRLIKQLSVRNPELADEFASAKHAAEAASKFVRSGGRFGLTGRGDINTYAIFAELVRTLIRPDGRSGVIVPSGIATDHTTKFFFSDVIENGSLVSLFDFENRDAIFPGVHRSYKFSLMTLTGSARPVESAEFAFFLHRTDQLSDEARRFPLTADDFALLNPNTLTCPIFRTRRDAEITRGIYERVPVLIDESKGDDGNPWGVRLMTMFHMSNDSHLFRTRAELEHAGWRLDGNVFRRRDERYLPLYEAKLIHQFDPRWATYDGEAARDLTDNEKMDPLTVALPRYWVPENEVEARLESRWGRDWLIGWRDITNSTNERTVIATVTPRSGVGNNMPLFITDPSIAPSTVACLVANLTSVVLDFTARFKVGGTHLNFFIINQVPVLAPSTYGCSAPWVMSRTLSDWLVERIIELNFTSSDLTAFAGDLGYNGPPFRWDPERRFMLRCELDAAFFHLYGINRDDTNYILDSFPIVKRKDAEQYGEYRTQRVILDMYDAMQKAIETGEPYCTRLDPPPAHPSVAHSAESRLGAS